MPSQDFAAALRLWRFGFAVLAAVAGMFGQVYLQQFGYTALPGLVPFGVPPLPPFAAGGAGRSADAVLRRPLPFVKLRESALRTPNRRNQGTFS